MSEAPEIRLVEAELYERDVSLRLPFRFGMITLDAAPQAFLRVRIQTSSGQEAWGSTAELMVPKWFDKDPALTNEDNFDQLRDSICNAIAAYEMAGPATAFGLAASTYYELVEMSDTPPLVAAFGAAQVDKAILDALCRLEGLSFGETIRANRPGITAALAPDLREFDLTGFLGGLKDRRTIIARHTVGMADPLTDADVPAGARLNDGLPETLEEVIATYGQTHFKLKIGGNIADDLDRLKRIASVLDGRDYLVTLDGNEQYQDAEGILELWRAVAGEHALDNLVSRTLFIEQPIARAAALTRDVSELSTRRPVIIDESDATYDAFPRARNLGYSGVSSKACKGLYKSIVNAARCVAWNTHGNAHHFQSGEDLTCQSGLAVQQDLALVSLLGIGHVERNGHHYVHGMAGAPPEEQVAFHRAHRSLYRFIDGSTCLRIRKGRIALGSLDCPGFASAVLPDFTAMRPVPLTTARLFPVGE